MHHLLKILASPITQFPGFPVVRGLLEPLDHPCLINVGRSVIDDLPLPAYAVDRAGCVKLLGEH